MVAVGAPQSAAVTINAANEGTRIVPVIPERFIDGFSIPLIFVLLALAGMIVYEIGFRIGRWHQARTHEEQEGFADTLVGAVLALLAFLLAFTVGMASSRFDARNDLALREANAIQTTYLRAMMLPEPFAENARELLREYVPLRVRAEDRAVNEANLGQAHSPFRSNYGTARMKLSGRSSRIVAHCLPLKSVVYTLIL